MNEVKMISVMKRQIFFLLMLIPMFAACNQSGLNPEFSELEYILEHSEEMTVSEQSFHSVVDGYGWKWNSTNEILEDGSLSRTGYYDNLIGVAPSYFYFEPESFTRFCYMDYIPGDCFYENSYEYVQSEIWQYNMSGKSRLMKVLSVDRSIIVCIEYLGVRATKNGLRDVSGLSVYSRMTDEELSSVRNRYSTWVLMD